MWYHIRCVYFLDGAIIETDPKFSDFSAFYGRVFFVSVTLTVTELKIVSSGELYSLF